MLFSPGTAARKQCQDYGLSREPIPLRLIRVQLKGGETDVLATSLLDAALAVAPPAAASWGLCGRVSLQVGEDVRREAGREVLCTGQRLQEIFPQGQ